MLANAIRVEQQIRTGLNAVESVVEVHGKGCLLGIEFAETASIVHSKLLDAKIITGVSSSANILRLLPPLCVTTNEVGMLVDVLASR